MTTITTPRVIPGSDEDTPLCYVSTYGSRLKVQGEARMEWSLRKVWVFTSA